MRALLVVLALGGFGLMAEATERPRANASRVSQTKLICKTGPEKRAPGQALKLYLNYHLPLVFEAEDPTMPLARQTLLLAGRPIVQLYFDKAAGPAGDQGERLQPMQCAFARRALKPTEPSQAQILLPPGQVNWVSQGIGQRDGGADRAVLRPAGDWSFAYQYEQVFTLELDDLKTFLTTQMPKAL